MILMGLILKSPGPLLASIGPLNLRWYGLLTAIGFLVALTVSVKLLEFRRKILANEHDLSISNNITEDELTNFSILVLLTGLIGARLWYVILQWNYYSGNLNEIVQIWHGGQSIQGGILGVIIGAWFFSKDYKELFFKLSLIASTVPLAQAIGRWGNFFNEEAFGIATNLDLPIKLYIHKTGLLHHPTFLYEAIWNLFNFAILMFLNKFLYEKVHSISIFKKDVILVSSYLIIYSIGRLMIESMRTDSLLIGNFAAATCISFIMIGVGAVGIFYAVMLSERK